MTYSIVARDPDTGNLGIAVASRYFAVGSLVPHISHNAAVATQSFVNPMWGVGGVKRLTQGESAESVMADFVRRDAGQAIRQAHMIDAQGLSAAHTGEQCTDWAGHVIAEGISIAGNMLTGPDVVSEALRCYQSNRDTAFAERLLLAMEAGEAAGGDKRGRQAAALRIHQSLDYPLLDIRADDHSDPLAELRRLLSIAEERAVPFAKTFATPDNFSGTPDRAELCRIIAEREEQLDREGVVSRSQATTL